MFALEKQVSVFDKFAINLLRGKGWETLQNRLRAALISRAGGKTGIEYLRWFGVTDREFTGSLDVNVREVTGAANEPEIVLPAHRKGHVLWCEVEAAILVPCAHEYQWGDHEATVPDWLFGIQFHDFFYGL
jgi:hypothetical protein